MYDSFYQYLFERTFWGSQGAGILAFAEDVGKWLIALRSPYVNEPNTWGIVGGKIDDDETSPDQAAKREFFEETDYNGPITLHKAFEYHSPEMNRNGGRFIYHNFIGTITKGQWEPKTNWETSRFAWVGYKGLMMVKPKHFGLRSLLMNSKDLIRSFSLKYKEEKLKKTNPGEV